jgi:manganese/zinc/iron transport system permease protein
MSPQFEIQLIAVIVAIGCALPGVFLVLRKMSMMSDSITHTILLGIVLAFLVTHDLSSPFLIGGAALMGVVTIWLTETLHRTRLLSEDAAIGIVFPLLFSIAVILITRYAGAAHLDTDSVLLGELAFELTDTIATFLPAFCKTRIFASFMSKLDYLLAG